MGLAHCFLGVVGYIFRACVVSMLACFSAACLSASFLILFCAREGYLSALDMWHWHGKQRVTLLCKQVQLHDGAVTGWEGHVCCCASMSSPSQFWNRLVQF